MKGRPIDLRRLQTADVLFHSFSHLSILVPLVRRHLDGVESILPGQGLPKCTGSKESKFLWFAAAKSCTTEKLIEVGRRWATATHFLGTLDVNSI